MTDTSRALSELAGLLAQAYRRALGESRLDPTTRDESKAYGHSGVPIDLDVLGPGSPHGVGGRGRRTATAHPEEAP